MVGIEDETALAEPVARADPDPAAMGLEQAARQEWLLSPMVTPPGPEVVISTVAWKTLWHPMRTSAPMSSEYASSTMLRLATRSTTSATVKNPMARRAASARECASPGIRRRRGR
ncbi:MAG: hypothetical protein R3C69_05820 [Geminicoccaceae bacterium]